MCSCVVRGVNNATRKAIPNRASRPTRTIVHSPVEALLSPVTGTTGVPSTITVGGTTVTSGGTTVSCNLTVCGATGDPKALKNNALRMTIENKTALSFIVTPFEYPEFIGC